MDNYGEQYLLFRFLSKFVGLSGFIVLLVNEIHNHLYEIKNPLP